MPALTEIMVRALVEIPYDVITKYNLGTLPFSCPQLWGENNQEYQEKLFDWLETNKAALDILLPNVIIFHSKNNTRVGHMMIDYIVQLYNATRIHMN